MQLKYISTIIFEIIRAESDSPSSAVARAVAARRGSKLLHLDPHPPRCGRTAPGPPGRGPAPSHPPDPLRSFRTTPSVSTPVFACAPMPTPAEFLMGARFCDLVFYCAAFRAFSRDSMSSLSVTFPCRKQCSQFSHLSHCAKSKWRIATPTPPHFHPHRPPSAGATHAVPPPPQPRHSHPRPSPGRPVNPSPGDCAPEETTEYPRLRHARSVWFIVDAVSSLDPLPIFRIMATGHVAVSGG